MANAILMALAPVFFVLALGYGAGKLRIIDNSRVDGFNALVMDFALPAALFVATASAPRSEFDRSGAAVWHPQPAHAAAVLRLGTMPRAPSGKSPGPTPHCRG